ncbi:hypothetical protein X798_06213 [Onchocerca flexuosa]|uniref:Uncharacterized protein n=1 Tax=Onchocerca flexuosa TaxID=387005 RepID=A0A238BNG2_9BILA|nr:hypothetical protein X798_06213 [Onchocerca flexuosa]
MFVGIAICTQGGILIMEWLIVYGTSWGLLIAVFCEIIVISFIYGINNFVQNLKEMLGFEPGYYWRLCWCTIISCFVTYEPLKYQDFVYPQMANILGLLFSFSTVSVIFIVGFYKLYAEKGDNFIMKLKAVSTPHRWNRSNNDATIESISNDEINL